LDFAEERGENSFIFIPQNVSKGKKKLILTCNVLGQPIYVFWLT